MQKVWYVHLPGFLFQKNAFMSYFTLMRKVWYLLDKTYQILSRLIKNTSIFIQSHCFKHLMQLQQYGMGTYK